MKKWEYCVHRCDIADVDATLNALGDAGWELVTVVVSEMPLHSGDRGIALVMKREKPHKIDGRPPKPEDFAP